MRLLRAQFYTWKDQRNGLRRLRGRPSSSEPLKAIGGESESDLEFQVGLLHFFSSLFMGSKYINIGPIHAVSQQTWR